MAMKKSLPQAISADRLPAGAELTAEFNRVYDRVESVVLDRFPGTNWTHTLIYDITKAVLKK